MSLWSASSSFILIWKLSLSSFLPDPLYFNLIIITFYICSNFFLKMQMLSFSVSLSLAGGYVRVGQVEIPAVMQPVGCC
jgi:hypothetical protein